MDFKKIIIFSLILVILSVSFVSAADLNNTHETELSRGGDNSLAIDNINLEHVGISDSENVLAEQSDNVKPGSFEDLQNEVNAAPEGSVLDLYRDYNGHEDISVTINKYLTIDGHGHTIDCKNAEGCYAFHSNSGTITLKNLNIINGLNDGSAFIDIYNGGAICIVGYAQYTIENCNFKNNYADDYGGAIYNGARTSVYIRNCTFESNYADDQDGGAIYSKGNLYIEDCSFTNNKAGIGGAICSLMDANINNSTFSNNYAEGYGGAIYAKNVYINTKQDKTEPFSSFFISNNAADDNGGAIYSEGKISAKNTVFLKNIAVDYGGAVYAKDEVGFAHCLFESNKAEENAGGAIYTKNDAVIDNCTFKNNWAKKAGGAIYADIITLANPSFFEYNIAYKGDGGAIYANKFNNDVKNAVFIGNKAGEGGSYGGGAIYINKENHVTFSQCQFINNHCSDKGGAFYLDSTSSDLALINNTFIDNTADEGQAVFNTGTYKKIEKNYWGDKKPSENNDILVEWKWIGFNKHHVDSNPRT